MAPDENTDEQKALIATLVSEYGISENSAEACLVATEWDMEGAKRVASLNEFSYLLVNFRFTGKNPIPHGGLVSILLNKSMQEPEFCFGLVLDGYEYLEDVSPYLPEFDFIDAILQPGKFPRDDTPWRKLKSVLYSNLTTDSTTPLFSIETGKVSEVGDKGQIIERDPLRDAVSALIKPGIDDIYVESVKLEIYTNLLNGFQYENLMENFRVDESDDVLAEIPGTTKKSEEFFKVHLMGQFIIDPHHGLVIEDRGHDNL